LVQRASSRPPPKALLEMAEMDGMGSWERRMNVPRSFERN
jgi:ABC-type sugar transport system permease subunit